MQTIGGYLIVAHETHNGWYAHTLTHAFKDLDAAKEYVRARNEQLRTKYFDEESGDSESSPTIHTVSPGLFKEVHERREHLSINDYYGVYALKLGEAITRQSSGPLWRRPGGFPSYMVGETEVFCTKSEHAAPAAEQAGPKTKKQMSGLISNRGRPNAFVTKGHLENKSLIGKTYFSVWFFTECTFCNKFARLPSINRHFCNHNYPPSTSVR